MVDNGVELEHAYEMLANMHKRHGSHHNPITWGGGDTVELKEQLNSNHAWCFGRRWTDVKTIYITMSIANGGKVQGGLARTMTKFGLNFKGRKHNALDDSINTFRLYKKFLDIMPRKELWVSNEKENV